MRSSTSSSPMWMRTVGPPGAQAVAVRMLVQSKGMARLFEAAPRRPDAEQAELIEERVHRAPRHRLEHDAEESAGAGKIAPPDGMAGAVFERRMEHACDFGPLFEPARDLSPA